MDRRLKKLKSSMDNTEFKNLHFNETHISNVQNKIKKQEEGEEEILLSIMQLLVYEHTGFTLTKRIRGRGIVGYEDNEGNIYTMLHRLEQKAYINSTWKEDGGKYYKLSQNGHKLLKKYESSSNKRRILRPLLGGSQT
ncbi:PadR family transcriptional regulator [Halobacillus sp. H74]|uniref:PadR family transcriptional regulator n=1 Tax=Halobacillus sp. H74 TaxID=3457436 RepID=UPI003FCDE17D